MCLTSLVYKGIKVDSDEEWFICAWLEELKEAGLVKHWLRAKESISLTSGLKIPYEQTIILKTKVKTVSKEAIILRPSEYTPDFNVWFTMDGWFYLVNSLKSYNKKKLFFSIFYDKPVMFEVKPLFDQNNMERLFKNNQKFIWDKHKIFINLIEPIELFKHTFVPAEVAPYFKYKKYPTGKNKGKKKVGDWKFDFEPKTIKEFLINKNNL